MFLNISHYDIEIDVDLEAERAEFLNGFDRRNGKGKTCAEGQQQGMGFSIRS